ncbi:membrane-associated tyrosine- and threonine-specific cdc2-inhibitory kinase [Chrysoperla carnea]|uniref:membrane-associated tyrosine- and threonine-specific cdc2-inhibitory kinase n=1 Tax=Chrysoperla carnea TaxID=189513 RepID=UPI001D07563E|nr:membrane-associated tyrosine- and threonine-specific cdc2-inhibitory kinase [Chrysoperla carnea]
MPKTPIPLINNQPSVYLTKKECIEAGLPLKASVVPKSPVKKSLIVPDDSGAESVSFIEPSESNLSIVYDPTCGKTYFNQCFYDVKTIGQGSFGVVYRVRFREDGQLYAIKKSKSKFYGKNDKRLKLEEVRKHEMIPKHPNCVQLYRSWVEDGFLYLQLELCNTSLEHFASRNHNISEEMLWNILADMLSAVKNLHDNNLIHLDIKLENILMCSDGTCKLADFGLVSDVNMIKPDTVEGDQKYLAPELLSGHFTKAADIFSLGIVMLELSCDLLLPSNGDLWQELRNDKFPETTKNVPKELMGIIKKMMASNYLNRPTVDDLLNLERIKDSKTKRREVIDLCDTCGSTSGTSQHSTDFINRDIINLCDTCESTSDTNQHSTDVINVEISDDISNDIQIPSSSGIEEMVACTSTPAGIGHSSTLSININFSPITSDADVQAHPWDRQVTRRKKTQDKKEFVITTTPKSVYNKTRLYTTALGRRRLF